MRMHPSPIAETSSPLLPSTLVCIVFFSPVLALAASPSTLDRFDLHRCGTATRADHRLKLWAVLVLFPTQTLTLAEGRSVADRGDVCSMAWSRTATVRCSASASAATCTCARVLIHGARAAVLRIKRDRAPIGAWLDTLDARAPKNVVVVAMANKLARIAWAVLSSGEDYKPIANGTPA
jgi:hypothetical protein